MNWNVPLKILLLLSAGFLAACSTVEGTGRAQLNMMSLDEEISLGTSAYKEALADETIIRKGPAARRVRMVGERIAAAANARHPSIAGEFDWEFVLVDDDEIVNAWALPGGKCAVYSGMLRVARTDDMLAAVMGHEAAHAIARHGGERLTQSAVLGIATDIALQDSAPGSRQAVMTAMGVGVVLPFSRMQETEADYIGLFISADAGYDPRGAVQLWEAMAEQGASSIEFLSTHPSHGTRIDELEELMPRAMEVYENRMQVGLLEPVRLKEATPSLPARKKNRK
ncbi:MAG: peptidase [Phycisphaerae bacterium]|nr:peptidase [Phycisphaerae bacterium]